MSAVTIRRETLDDVDHVVAVLAAVAAEGRWIGTEVPFDQGARAERIRDELRHADTNTGFVADVDGTIVGSIGLGLAPYGVVHLGMALLDGHRGLGIGSQLLQAGIEWAREAGAHKLALEVWPHNDAAVALYKKFGFVEEGVLRQHYRRNNNERWDAVVMGLIL